MKKFLPIIVIVVIVVAGVLIWNKKSAEAPKDSINTTPEVSETTQTGSQKPTNSDYSYTNSEFKFAVKLPGLVVTKKEASKDPILHPIVFTFGKGDQASIPEEKRIQNSMAVYIWKNKAEFELLMINIAPTEETINGIKFKKYVVTEGSTTIYRYATEKNGVLYDVGVSDPNIMTNFYLLD